MDLEGILLSERSSGGGRQILHDISHLHHLKEPNLQKQRVEWWLSGMGDVDQMVQTCCQISFGDLIYIHVIIVNNIVFYTSELLKKKKKKAEAVSVLTKKEMRITGHDGGVS